MTRLLLLLLGIMLAAAAAAADAPQPDLSGVWLPVSKESGRWPAQPPFTPAMAAARASWNKAVAPIDVTRGDDEYISCMPYALPQMVLAITQYPFEIFQTPSQILIHAEVYGQIRRIHMTDASPPVDRLPAHTGYSRGRWEGNQLVVETSHILPMHEGNRYPGSPAMRVVERIWLQGSGPQRQLIDEVTITAPLVYTQPVTV